MMYLIDSFDRYIDRADLMVPWAYKLGNGGVLSAGGVLVNGSTVSYCNRRIRSMNRLRIGFRHKCLQRAPSVTNSSFLHLPHGGESNTYNQVGLGMNPNGTLSIFYGANFSGMGGTTLGNGSTVLNVGAEHWIELDIVLSTTATGSVELRIDGISELALSGIRTSSRPVPAVDRVSLVAGANAQHWFDALYVGDGAEGWLGAWDASLIPASQLALPPGAMVGGGVAEVLTPLP